MASVIGITRNLLQRTAYFALFAVLLNALAPTLSYAMAAGKSMAVVEMCTSFGLKKVLVSQSGDESDTSAAHDIKHCPFCLSADQTPPAPIDATSAAIVPPHTLLAVIRDPQFVPDPLLFWSATHKRGPPSLS